MYVKTSTENTPKKVHDRKTGVGNLCQQGIYTESPGATGGQRKLTAG